MIVHVCVSSKSVNYNESLIDLSLFCVYCLGTSFFSSLGVNLVFIDI